jgi:membrane-associated phospholipid phosphatase
MFLGVSITIALKYLVARERPENMIIEYGGYSFPSGHSVFAVLFY